MTTVADHLKAGYSALSADEVLQLRVSALLGVSDSAASALGRIGVETIFDLGSSWLFANAAASIQSDTGETGLSRNHLIEGLPDEERDSASVSLSSLRGMSNEDADALKQALAIESVREFALWPPRLVAKRMVSDASGAGGDPEEAHAEALRPRLGEFPTERVYYNSLVMLAVTEDTALQPLTGVISLQPAVDDAAGFGKPAVGALVTLSQSWYAKGITLGHMLHSLALAPGEATRIAVVDWSRRTRTSTSDTIEETDRLDNASEHSRAISEVQNAVASEMQVGGSMSSGWSKSSSVGRSSGVSAGGGVAGDYMGVTGVFGIGAGMAKSSQEAETEMSALSSSWSVGNRSVTAEMSQHVNDRTEQHSTSVRNRRASSVREVSQSEHEQVSTRVVANYNHMHALTVQYYEVVQIYRVLAQLHSAQRVLFLPFELLDFSGDGASDVVARFRGQLLAAALTRRVAALLRDDRGEVEVRAAVRMQLPTRFSDVAAVGVAATMARVTSADGIATPASSAQPSASAPTVLTAPAPLAVRRITSPGPLLATVPGDVELVAVSFDSVRVDRARFDQAGVPADSSTFAVPDTTFQVDLPGGLPLRNVTTIQVAKVDADADSGTMTLHYRTTTQQFALPMPLDLAPDTSMQKVAFVTADPSNRKAELMAHLQANRAYYSQAVLARLDSATLVMLLSRFTWKGRPLGDQVEPTPVAVAGNYLVLRAPIEEDEAAGIDDVGTTWGELLNERALTSEQRDDRLVPIPTGGVFAEAVLGRSNSAEKLDITRFWNWQDSPIPLQPTEIAAVNMGSRAMAEDLRPGQLGAPVLNILNPTTIPDPAGLSAVLGAVASANMFRDMSGLAGTQALSEAVSAGTLNAATEAGKLAGANLKTVTDQAVAMGKEAADMWKTMHGKGGGSGAAGSGSGSNISADGARINHGRDMDQRGVPDGGGDGFKVTGSQSEFQGAGGGGDGSAGGGTGGGNPAISRELAFADTAATGVSPAMLAGTANALGVGALGGLASNLTAASPNVMQPLETVMLAFIRDDVEASGMSLQGVTLHAMRDHPLGARFRAIGLFAWTNSSADIYVDIEAYLQMIADLQKGPSRKSAKDAVLYARGSSAAVVRHEVVHVEQFRQTGPPASFKQMLTYELAAYGCATTAEPQSSLKWLAGAAETFFLGKLKLTQAEATAVIDFVEEQFENNCRVLNTLNALTNPDSSKLDFSIQQEMITAKFLPEKVRDLQIPGRYRIEDLYKM